MTKYPAIFVSHGAPTLAVDQNAAHAFLQTLGSRIGRPKAILVISAHWMTQEPALSLAEQPETLYDFGGFPEIMYQLTYPAPGAPALARRTAELLRLAGFEVGLQANRGLDHGAWVPLMLMYPEADIPVFQLSIQPQRSPADHWRMGEALRPLRDEGILIVGSGGATHNLREFGLYPDDAKPPAYVAEFERWLVDAVIHARKEDLVNYLEKGPHAARNHPTTDHFYPFLVAAGAGDEGTGGTVLHQSVTFGILEMDAFSYA